jgi:hypothetical protein
MREIEEAEFRLKSAKYRANDALTLRFLNIRSLRHDDAPRLFLKLVQQNKFPAKFSNLRTTVFTPAIQSDTI